MTVLIVVLNHLHIHTYIA